MPKPRFQDEADMKTTIRDVAREVNLSHTTVSRVLNGREDISIPDATRQRVQQAAQTLGYKANPAARSLVTGRTGIVSLWTQGIYRSFWGDIIVQVEKQARSHNYELIINDLSAHVARPGDDDPNVWPVDGILAIGCPQQVAAYLRLPESQRQPLISMGVFHNETTDFVGLQLSGAVSEAVTHLIGQGCRRVAYLTTQSKMRHSDERWMAYENTVRAAGQSPEVIVLPPESHRGTRAGARHKIIQSIRERGCPDGLFCHNDEIALGAYRGLCDLGLKVPDDCAIIGCDGIEDTEYLEVPLSTIALPVEAMCEAAWRLLARRWAAPNAPVEGVQLSGQFLPRASSQRPNR